MELDRLHFEVLDRVNRILVRGTEVEQAMKEVLEFLLDVFECDRVFLLHPFEVDCPTTEVAFEATRPAWPGALASRASIPMSTALGLWLHRVLASERALVEERESPGAPHPLMDDPALAAYGIRAMAVIAVRPRSGSAWGFGLHHCEKDRFRSGDAHLIEALGLRLADGLSGLLLLRQLRESEARFRVLVDHAPEAIVLFDVELERYVDFNTNAEQLFGLTRDELLERGPADTSPEFQADGRATADAVPELIGAALSGACPEFEWTHLDASGNEVPCLLRLVRMPHPERLLVRGSITDISARKRAEAERAALAEQLVQAQKMEAVGQLTGGVAHEFNNILTVIVGNLELVLGDGLVPDEPREHLDQSLAAARRAAALTARLLAFSRRQTLRPEPIDLGGLLQSMAELLRRTLGETVRLEVQIAPELWSCAADPSQLENAVLNLAINARDALSGAGGLRMEASNVTLDEGASVGDVPLAAGEYVKLSVTDDGPGMSEVVRRQAFEPFFTTKDVGEGSGLGLSMVYGFARQSGGAARIATTGERGRGGACVEVFLPRSSSAPVVTRGTGTKAPVLPADCPPGHGERVLLVEDADDLRVMALRLLERLGYSSVAVRTGAEAIDALRSSGPFDLLFTDVVLPGGLNGLTLSEEARVLQPGLRVLLTSGYAQGESLPPQLEAQQLVFLPKPYALGELARAVRRALAVASA